MNNELKDYFYGNLSAEEEAHIQKKICEACEDENLDSAMRDLFDECDRAAEKVAHSRIAGTSKRRFLPATIASTVIAVAASLALLVFLPKAYEDGQKSGEERISSIEWLELNVPLGQTRTVTLCDGTILQLAAGSRMTYPKEFSGSKRSVFVTGEAYAQVTKDPEHPFVINSGDVSVTVLGTTFNYKNYPDSRDVELLLLEGSVRVGLNTASGDRDVRMTPGDRMLYDRELGTVDLSRFSPEKYKNYFGTNTLYFFDVEMSEIARTLSRRFNQRIVVQDAVLASRRFFSIFSNNESLDQVLASMNSDGKMQITKSNGIIYLRSL